MTWKELLNRIHTDERTGIGPVHGISHAAEHIAHGLFGEDAMLRDKLLLTNADAVQLPGSKHCFHRKLVVADASPKDQMVLLRRVRRCVHTEVAIDQQRVNTETHGISNNDNEPVFTIVADETEPGFSQRVFMAGISYYDRHRETIDRLLGKPADLDNILMIGEEVSAHELIGQLRAAEKEKRPSSYEADMHEDQLLSLRQATRGIPLAALKLYHALEIPLRWQRLEENPHAVLKSGSLTLGDGIKPCNAEYIAAHELCHAMIGHDFIKHKIKHSHAADQEVPSFIKEASDEFLDRARRIIRRDPQIIREYEKMVGAGSQLFEDLHKSVSRTLDTYTEDMRERYRTHHRIAPEFEDVSEYYAIRQVIFNREPELMEFLSPRMNTICDELEQSIRRDLAQAKEGRGEFDNPIRNEIFRMIQKDQPVIALPPSTIHM